MIQMARCKPAPKKTPGRSSTARKPTRCWAMRTFSTVRREVSTTNAVSSRAPWENCGLIVVRPINRQAASASNGFKIQVQNWCPTAATLFAFISLSSVFFFKFCVLGIPKWPLLRSAYYLLLPSYLHSPKRRSFVPSAPCPVNNPEWHVPPFYPLNFVCRNLAKLPPCRRKCSTFHFRSLVCDDVVTGPKPSDLSCYSSPWILQKKDTCQHCWPNDERPNNQVTIYSLKYFCLLIPYLPAIAHLAENNTA